MPFFAAHGELLDTCLEVFPALAYFVGLVRVNAGGVLDRFGDGVEQF